MYFSKHKWTIVTVIWEQTYWYEQLYDDDERQLVEILVLDILSIKLKLFLETLFIIKFQIKTQEIKCSIHKTMDFPVKKKAENDKKYFWRIESKSWQMLVIRRGQRDKTMKTEFIILNVESDADEVIQW